MTHAIVRKQYVTFFQLSVTADFFFLLK